MPEKKNNIIKIEKVIQKSVKPKQKKVIQSNNVTHKNNKIIGELTDGIGQKYKWVRIGNQIWMAENLNLDVENGTWCYDNDPVNCEKYGRLYTWEAAKRVADKIPGWHLPTDDEWTQLERYLGMSKSNTNAFFRDNNVGKKLKSIYGWESGYESNNSGFSALPGGCHRSDSFYNGSINAANFWSATPYNNSEVWVRQLNSLDTGVYRDAHNKDFGNSVRLVKD